MLSSITISQITNRLLLLYYIKEGDDFNHSGSPLVNYNHQLRHILFSILLVAATNNKIDIPQHSSAPALPLRRERPWRWQGRRRGWRGWASWWWWWCPVTSGWKTAAPAPVSALYRRASQNFPSDRFSLCQVNCQVRRRPALHCPAVFVCGRVCGIK